MNNDDKTLTYIVGLFLIFVGLCVIIGLNPKEEKETCIKSYCDNTRVDGSIYCYSHKATSYSGRHGSGSSYSETSYNSSSDSGSSYSYSSNGSTSNNSYKSSSSSNSYSNSSSSPGSSNYNSYDSYDEGYDAVYEDEDYDWDRYCEDEEYANGVDDAMDEMGYGW